MEALKICGIVFLVVYLIVFLYLLIKTRKPLRLFLANVLMSLWLFAVIELTGFLTAFHIPLNWYSLGAMSLGGIPATITLLILRLLIF